MLAPFITPILTAIRWLGINLLPVMLSSFVVGLLVKFGVAVTSWMVITYTAEYMRDQALTYMGTIGAGTAGDSVLGLLSMFGVFEGISIIVSVLLAKAAWQALKPTLGWLTTPGA